MIKIKPQDKRLPVLFSLNLPKAIEERLVAHAEALDSDPTYVVIEALDQALPQLQKTPEKKAKKLPGKPFAA